jgi:RNA polymerase sigma-70 factor (ECF subfamily)
MLEATPALALPYAESTAGFAGLVERQSRFVFRVAYALLRNRHDAEDTVQETFLKIYRGGRWDAIENERAFLARAAWRLAVDKLKRGKSVATRPDLEPAAAGANPEDAAVAADWNAAVHRLMDALPQELRQPLALSAIDELNSREIAEVMGIAEGTVRTRIMRARGILKQKLAALDGRPL